MARPMPLLLPVTTATLVDMSAHAEREIWVYEVSCWATDYQIGGHKAAGQYQENQAEAFTCIPTSEKTCMNIYGIAP